MAIVSHTVSNFSNNIFYTFNSWNNRAGINKRIPVSLEFMRLTGIFLYPLGTVWVQTPYSGEIFACDL